MSTSIGLRGTTETLKRDRRDTNADDIAVGLFLKLFEYTLQEYNKLVDIDKCQVHLSMFKMKHCQTWFLERSNKLCKS